MPTWISVVWNFISAYFSKGKMAAEFLMLCRWAAGAKMYLYNIFISVPLIFFTKFYEKLTDSRKEKFFIIPERPTDSLERERIFRFNTGISFRRNVVSCCDYQMFY